MTDYETKLRKQSARNDAIATVISWTFGLAAGLGVIGVIAAIPGLLFMLAWNLVLVPLTGWSEISFWGVWAVWLVFGFFFRGGGSKR